MVENGNPEIGGIDGTLSRNRSLDPLTPIATELLTVIAEIAVERAKANATEAIKDILQSSVCKLSYNRDDAADIYFRSTLSRACRMSKRRPRAADALKKAYESTPRLPDSKRREALKSARDALGKGNYLAKKKCVEDRDGCASLKAATKNLEETVKQFGEKVSNGSGGLVLVFSRVCKALDGLRIREMAESSSNVLVRALSGDLTEYAFVTCGRASRPQRRRLRQGARSRSSWVSSRARPS